MLLHPEIQAWLRPSPLEPLTRWDVKRLLDGDIEHWRRHGYGPWLVRERGAFRGRVGLRRSALLDGVELAWAIVPGAWGRGFASGPARAALELARESRLGHVVAFTVPHNAASIRIMERLGMEHAGEIEHAGVQHLIYRA